MPTNRAEINEWMDRASSGDDRTFGALASAVQDELFRFALALGLGREDAAEVTKEVLMRAYAGRSTWKGGSDAMAWLCGIAVNVAREYHRKERRRQAAWLDPTWRGASGEAGPGGPSRKEGPDPDQLRRLVEAVAELPSRQREAVACRYLRRMSIKETAEAMGCAEGTVKSAVSAALERLRDIMDQHR
jgi:RNA polymerase sigma factor (sigma-70 family)